MQTNGGKAMRNVLAIAVVSMLALGGVTACSSNTPAAPATPTAAADQTRNVCDKALAAAAKGKTDALAKIEELGQAIAAGQPQAVLIVDFQRIIDFWKTTLNEIKDEPVKTEVSEVLDETVAYLEELTTTQSLNATSIRTRLTDLEDDLAEACA